MTLRDGRKKDKNFAVFIFSTSMNALSFELNVGCVDLLRMK